MYEGNRIWQALGSSRILRLLLDQLPTRTTKKLFEKTGRVNAATEIGVLQNGLLERNGRFDAGDHVFAQRTAHFLHRFAAIFHVCALESRRISSGDEFLARS